LDLIIGKKSTSGPWRSTSDAISMNLPRRTMAYYLDVQKR
jgi:hypothetical protein